MQELKKQINKELMLEFILKCQSVDQPFVFVNFVFGLVDQKGLEFNEKKRLNRLWP